MKGACTIHGTSKNLWQYQSNLEISLTLQNSVEIYKLEVFTSKEIISALECAEELQTTNSGSYCITLVKQACSFSLVVHTFFIILA